MPIDWSFEHLVGWIIVAAVTGFFGWSGWWIAKTLRFQGRIGMIIGLVIWIALIYYSSPLRKYVIFALTK